MSTRIANRRLWRTADDQVVEEGDPAARRLLAAGPGDEIDPALDIDIPAKFLQKDSGTTDDEDTPEATVETVTPVEVPAAPAVETKPARTTRKPAAKRTAKRT